jgi:hypothetical protein
MKHKKKLERMVAISPFGGARRFAPHQFQTQVQLLGEMPSILISKEAYDTMFYIVSESPEEVSWLGTVRRDGMTFLIEEVFLFDQEVSGTHTRMDPESVGAFFAQLASQPGGVEKANAIRFWGHSHVNMGVTPSGSYGRGDYGDLSCMYRFGESAEYFIMGIANKQGNFRFEIFFYDTGVRVVDVEWSLYEPEQGELRAKIAKELEQKVRRPAPVVNMQFGFGHHYRHFGAEGGYNNDLD